MRALTVLLHNDLGLVLGPIRKLNEDCRFFNDNLIKME
jgi:hypothetical protein